MFEDSDIIYAYTWDNAVEDGVFVDVSGYAKKAGFVMPVALTSNLFYTHIQRETDEQTNLSLNAFLMLLAIYIKSLKERGKANTSQIRYHAEFEKDIVTEVIVNIEARSPKNPQAVMTILLPEDD